MTKDELTNFISNWIGFIKDDLEALGDRELLIENAQDGGNHDDSFSLGETLGRYRGQLSAFEKVLEILEETPNVEHNTN